MASRSLLRSSASSSPRRTLPSPSFSKSFHSATPALAYGHPSTNKPDPFNVREDAKHATQKPGDDPQSLESRLGRQAKERRGSDNATGEKDTTSSTARTKKEHPEAPTLIGMQDERGKKGT
ncbi:hypothetical protein P152DRAFT_446384 [Eremomyces bilateralis CBS 781.70]|uniref:Uncharacterized protein n=1 Tax=Eremomyces bilateralis CBS 781.70 TaxID=1392243 RepID=A0A6G1GBM7_9PEZI|nr:uncharacterized protein P152DRAFT_446384 [Eremomyces bilateralis CBS 781.70]KAF1815301.1 hypothetical protein P152DRAFT_446384 [Eremomyces bilateralis CBS 781.70]